MKISFKQFLAANHSWSINLNIARKLKELGHVVHLDSTNGYTSFPEDLKENIKCFDCADDKSRDERKCKLDNEYDLSIAYTAMFHFKDYLSRGKVKFGMYNYDSDKLPVGFAKNHIYADYIIQISNYAKKTLVDAGVPESKVKVIPHSYRDEYINRTNKIDLPTDRKYKVLVNIQQPHKRKGLEKILESWGKAFTNKDDVALIMKVKIKQPESPFDVYYPDKFDRFKKKYPNHAPVIVYIDFLDYISDLYRSVDIVFSASHIETFHLPSLEGLVSKKIVIASGGETGCGNVDFMNENNSLLIKGKVARLPMDYQYMTPSRNASMFDPNTDHAAELLKLAVSKYDELKIKFNDGMDYVINNYSSTNVTNQILDLYKSCKKDQ